MIIYLVGPDSYRRGIKLRELIRQYKEKNKEIDLLDVDLEEDPTKWEGIRDFLNQPSMFVDKKIAVVRESGAVPVGAGSKEWVKTLKAFLDTPDTFVVISDHEGPRKEFQFLMDVKEYQEFNELEGRMLEMFVRKEAQVRGVTFAPSALEYFLRHLFWVESRSWTAINEIGILALAGFKGSVSQDDLKKLFTIGANEKVYEIARAFVFERQWKTKLALLERALAEKVAEAHLFNTLAFQVRGDDIEKLADFDVAIKSGNLDYEEALTSLALGA